MNARWRIVTPVAIALIIIGLALPGTAQDQSDARISELEKRVAVLEAEVFGTSATSPMSTTPALATPAGATGSPAADGGISVDPASVQYPVAGNAFHLLGPGIPGELSIVAQGPIPGVTEVPIVLRNNTSEQLVEVGVGAEVRDASGGLIGSASASPGDFVPILDPGAVTFAVVTFDEPLPNDATVTFFTEGGSNPTLLERFPTLYGGVELIEFVASSERILGSVRNISEAPIEITGTLLSVACFDASGSLSGAPSVTTARERLEPGETTSFETFSPPPPCDFFLVSGYGRQ